MSRTLLTNLTYYTVQFLSCFDQHNSRESGDAEAVCKLLQAAAIVVSARVTQ
jgi:hypothetical protein